MELNIDALTLGEFIDLEQMSGRDMQWWLDWASGDGQLERATDVLAVVCVTQKIDAEEARQFVLKDLFGGE